MTTLLRSTTARRGLRLPSLAQSPQGAAPMIWTALDAPSVIRPVPPRPPAQRLAVTRTFSMLARAWLAHLRRPQPRLARAPGCG